ncbi:uncharacterized protein AB675_3937 [Cyphellophora attinorum]|uniref:Uncharacterized protein n=1 Tax=Cyphellophora attinorum TaxID=1664694 RepID=A0A0N0NK18_9EURO|nr:uncharacterized protein AB675_3937 [Phialophora attinorum]KPI37631.1 hypothetical protein AB675_3937 [Phialophora attinorum]
MSGSATPTATINTPATSKTTTPTSDIITKGSNGAATNSTNGTNGTNGTAKSSGTDTSTTATTAVVPPKINDLTAAELETALHVTFDKAKKLAWDSEDATPEALVAILATYAIQEVHACGFRPPSAIRAMAYKITKTAETGEKVATIGCLKKARGELIAEATHARNLQVAQGAAGQVNGGRGGAAHGNGAQSGTAQGNGTHVAAAQGGAQAAASGANGTA